MPYVTFRLQAPAPGQMVSEHRFTRTNLDVEINSSLSPQAYGKIYSSVSSQEAHDGREPLELIFSSWDAPIERTTILMLSKVELKNLAIRFYAGWVNPDSLLFGLFTPVTQFESFEVDLPPEYLHLVDQAERGDTLDLLVSVDEHMNTTLTAARMPRIEAAPVAQH